MDLAAPSAMTATGSAFRRVSRFEQKIAHRHLVTIPLPPSQDKLSDWYRQHETDRHKAWPRYGVDIRVEDRGTTRGIGPMEWNIFVAGLV